MPKRSGRLPEGGRCYLPGLYPRSRTRPCVARCTLGPPPLSTSVRANTSQPSLHCPSRSCEGLRSCRSDCLRCGHMMSKRIDVRLSAMSLRPYQVMIQGRGREGRVRYVHHHLPEKPKTRVLLATAGEPIFRYMKVGNRRLFGTKAGWYH